MSIATKDTCKDFPLSFQLSDEDDEDACTVTCSLPLFQNVILQALIHTNRFQPHRSESLFLWRDFVPFWLVWYMQTFTIHASVYDTYIYDAYINDRYINDRYIHDTHILYMIHTFMIHAFMTHIFMLHAYIDNTFTCIRICIQILSIHIPSISSPRFARLSWRAAAEWNSLVSWASIRPLEIKRPG